MHGVHLVYYADSISREQGLCCSSSDPLVCIAGFQSVHSALSGTPPHPILSGTPCPALIGTPCLAPYGTPRPVLSGTPHPFLSGTPRLVLSGSPCPALIGTPTHPTLSGTSHPALYGTPRPVLSGSPYPVRSGTPHPTFFSFSIMSSILMSALYVTLLSICVSHSQSSLFFLLKITQALRQSAISCLRRETCEVSEQHVQTASNVQSSDLVHHRTGQHQPQSILK